ncbi:MULTISPECIES: hypothetical protein [Streptomyces]|uniref:Uncharacterized protein n=1 Tax=Streptomyces lycii TaxID=2654337 RepID=A0ABQ7FP89_9ACTN|nr:MULTISPECIES: hypothetical protein [Streptomyces]KAF4409581.1 hypothetical protein GCU69_08170 [Streptomyces lycii]PGH49577.1 hypothetical protein CRI70_16780 [Streptomyces sp. Ru87]
MTYRIRLALLRTLDRVIAQLVPATGRRRAVPGRARVLTATGLRLVVRATDPPRRAVDSRPPVADRRGVRGALPVLDGTGPLVRPYLVAHEREERRQERRDALALALYGADPGPWAVSGHTIGTRAMSRGALEVTA